jgi:predicted ArsR family transcriptional regulator
MDHRASIMALIKTVGGAHKSAIARDLSLNWGTVDYHLSKLSREGVIVLQYWGQELWAFDVNFPERQKAKLVSVMRPSRLHLLDFLAGRDAATVKELSDELQYCRATVRKHLGHLLHAGVVSRTAARPHRYKASNLQEIFDD